MAFKEFTGELNPEPKFKEFKGELETEIGTAGAIGRGAEQGLIPSIVGGLAGTAAGVAASPFITPVGGVAAGLTVGTAAAMAAAAAQEKALQAFPTLAGKLGLSEKERIAAEEQHPYASAIGQAIPQLLTARPDKAVLGIGKAATEEAKAATSMARKQALAQAGIGGGMEAGFEAVREGEFDPKMIAMQAAAGALGSKQHRLGDVLMSPGTKAGEAIASLKARPPEPATPPAPAVYPGSEELSPHVVNGRRLTNGEMDAMRGRTPTEPPPAEPARPAAEVPASDWHDTEASMNELLGRRPAKPVEPPKVEEPVAPRTETPRVEEAAPPTAPRTEAAGPGYTPDYTPFDGMTGLTHTFKTERGSTYGMYENKSTQRNRSGANHEDPTTGLQPKSWRTIFMTPEAAERIGVDFQNPDIPTILYPVGPDEVAVIVTRDEGGFREGQVLSMTRFSDEPKVGLTPVEIYDSNSPIGNAGRGVHFGNKIVEVNPVSRKESVGNAPEAKQPAAPRTETPTQENQNQETLHPSEEAVVSGEAPIGEPPTQAPIDVATAQRYAEIDKVFANNRKALKAFKVGDDVEFTQPGTYTQPDGSKREGLIIRGKLEKIQDARQGMVKVGNHTVAARVLRKAEAPAPTGTNAPPAEGALFSRTSTEGEGVPVELNRPGVPFQDGMAFSPGVDRKIAGLARSFRKDLGIEADVYVTTMRDAHRDLAKFKEQYAKVAELASDPRNAGVVQQMPDGSWVMLLEDSASWAHRIETLAHEFGHIHEKEYFARQPKAVKDAIYGEFGAWLEDSGYRSAREHVESLRARKAGKMTGIPNPEKTGADLDPYWRKFEEWYADQVSRWATTSKRPLTLVGQFFSRLAESMMRFYAKLRNAKYLPNTTFKEYMDGVHERHYPNGPAEMGGPSYSKKVAETRITRPVINYKGHIIGEPTWNLPPPEKFFGFLQKGDWYSKMVDNAHNLGQAVKEARRAAAENEAKFNEDFDPHTKMMLYRPREAKAKLNFIEKHITPWAEAFRKASQKFGVTREDVHNYLLAKHAEETNAHIRRIGGMDDGGSGMTDAAAREFLGNLPADKREALEGLSQRAQIMLSETRRVLVESGYHSAEDMAAMNDYYQHYVPLNRKEGELDFVRDYKGIQGSTAVKGDFTRRRKGSTKEVNDIMENIILQHERAIKKAEHNRVRQALYGMALQNPNKNFMTALNPDAIKNEQAAHEELTRLGVDPREGMDLIAMRGMPKSARLTQSETGPKVQFKMDPSKLNSQNVISLRVNGKDRFVVMNANDPRALQTALAIKGADLKILGPWLGTIARVTRFLASVNTQYNPVFGLWNFARDTIAAPFNMTVSNLSDRKLEVMKNVMPAMGGLFKEIRNPEATGYWADRVRQWKQAGGKTQYAPSFKGAEQEAIILGNELKKLDRNSLHKAAAATFRGLAHYNDMMEGAVRVAAFDASLKKQMAAARVEQPTPTMLDKAALDSQEVTVNFNKHGSNTQTLSALYAFFSSAMQGANKTLEVLHGPAGRKIIAGGMALGAFQSMLLAMNDFDENQPSSYIKNKNFIIPTGDGKYIMIPLPLGLNILPSLGRTISDAAFRSAGVITGTKSAGERVADVLGVFSDAFNPLGGGTFSQTLAPTIADPFLAVSQNKDAFGRPISREDMPSRPTPGYLRSRENASAAGNLIAEALNRISGGTEFQKGQISPTADDLDYLAGQALGGAYREAKKGVETIKSGFTGEEQPLYKIPIVGKIAGNVNDPASVAAQFYQNIKTMYGYKQEIQGRMKERQDVQEFLRETPDARLWSAAQTFENRIAELNKTRKEMIKREAAPELIRRIDDTKTKIMNQFNELVRNAQR